MADDPQEYTLEVRFNIFGTLEDVEGYIKSVLNHFEEGYVTAIFDEEWEEVERGPEVQRAD